MKLWLGTPGTPDYLEVEITNPPTVEEIKAAFDELLKRWEAGERTE